MKISGPFHKFLCLPDGDVGHDYIKQMSVTQGIEVADDILMEIYPNIAEIESYNPSTRSSFKGINTTGPTVISGAGLKVLLSALDDFLEKIFQGPNQIELGGGFLEKQDLYECLQNVRNYIALANDKGKKVLHLGV